MFRNVLKLLGATSLSQFLPILILPILTIYLKPEVFGYLGSFISLSLIITVFITLRFEPSIVLCNERSKTQSENILTITLYTTALIVLILFIISVFYIIPFQIFMCFIATIFCFSGNKVVEQFLISREEYTQISKNKLTLAISTTITHLIATFSIGEGSYLLIYSYTFSVVICNLFFLYKANFKLFPSIKIKSFELLLEHKRFGQFEMPSDFIFQLSQNLPVVIIMTVFGAEIAGIYSIAEKMILLPVSMIGSTLGMVYYREMSKVKSHKELAEQAKLILNCLFGLIIFGVLTYYFTIDYLVNIIFEKEYSDLSSYTDYLIIYGIVLFISSPLSGALWKGGKQNVNLALSILTLFLRCVMFYVVANNFNFETSLLFLVLGSILPRVLLLCFCMRVLSLKLLEIAVYTLLLLSIILTSYQVFI